MRIPIQQLALTALLLHSTNGAPAGLLDTVGAVTKLLALPANYVQLLAGVLGTKPPTGAKVLNAAELQKKLGAIWNTGGGTGDFYGKVQRQISQGIIPSGLLSSFQGLLGTGLLGSLDLAGNANKLVAPINAIDSINNNNPRNPAKAIWPRKDPADAPYTLTESQLRQVIFIPQTFTYGTKPPVIFIPGTGVYGGETFSPNLLKLLSNVPYADPVWLNIPGALLNDAQINSEYVAYAINYINGITNKNSSIISWSQGGLDTQWAFTFWPSTRSAVSDFFPVSPDFHGTVLANVLCLSPGNGALNAPCDPSVIQQQYTSVFVNTLRARGGADAYVPTTTFYTALLDEVVEPQQGTAASAYLNDARRVGVTNIEVQSVCPGRPAGSIYGHATMLFNPLTAALIKDVLQRGQGPAQVGNIDLDDVCKDFIAPGLSLEDGIATAGSIVAAAIRLLAYLPKLIAEPGLMAYARV
ncbi:Lipase b [Colletotrichum higginsianum IMI 349063]|uniref:Lipase b n=2 Tax=Colletotrichum higginsianum (strain IMI 349063) TaxID=759273 RepID=A0A1B7XXH8_COLHI|nr:Lipase b [Colletotrichum higginsianum IMI 349063]OBR04468.1 Lipase b [Colletotrichum higginsianum IMI 349063]GJC99105.1 lipase b [Colletotrichum higginsianum]